MEKEVWKLYVELMMHAINAASCSSTCVIVSKSN